MTRMLAEWEPQEFVQLVFPHESTDWNGYLDEAIDIFVDIAKNIAKYQKVLIVTKNIKTIKERFSLKQKKHITFVNIDSDDTWSRDFGGISVEQDGKIFILDFVFNGWGKKFDAKKDNKITQKLKLKGLLKGYGHQSIKFVLEGGSIESNGEGVILTTSKCLLEKNRNPRLNQKRIESSLMQYLGAKKVLWLDHGYLAGDDTDSHIDTLARFVNSDTIVYQSCDDENDQHFYELQKMHMQLKKFKNLKAKPFKLVALPWIEPKYDKDDPSKRLPATYANFLIINGAVLVPTYNDKNDHKAIEVIRSVFPKHDVIGIDCTTLIRQHGSLHCVTMQYPSMKG